MPKDEQTLGQHSVPSIIVCQKAPSIADIIVKITPSSLKKQTISYSCRHFLVLLLGTDHLTTLTCSTKQNTSHQMRQV